MGQCQPQKGGVSRSLGHTQVSGLPPRAAPQGAPPPSPHQATCTSGYSTPSSSTACPWKPSAAPSRLATLASSPGGTSTAEWSCSSTSRTGTLKKSPLTRSVGAHLPQPGLCRALLPGSPEGKVSGRGDQALLSATRLFLGVWDVPGRLGNSAALLAGPTGRYMGALGCSCQVGGDSCEPRAGVGPAKCCKLGATRRTRILDPGLGGSGEHGSNLPRGLPSPHRRRTRGTASCRARPAPLSRGLVGLLAC